MYAILKTTVMSLNSKERNSWFNSDSERGVCVLVCVLCNYLHGKRKCVCVCVIQRDEQMHCVST